MKSNPVTPVIFRRWPKSEGGEVVAIFTRTPATNDPYMCGSYMHRGQHAACDPVLLIRITNSASVTEKDVAALKRELEHYGPPDAHYNLKVKKKHTQADLRARLIEIKRWRGLSKTDVKSEGL